MCGIAGYVDLNERPDAAILAAMAHALRRRGPDAQGTLVDGHCGLAHRRLSIIDLAGSPQPMQVSGVPVSLAFNGEIYNYQELRRRLVADGEDFVWAGDTEVLLRMVARRWQHDLPRLEGMFAFAAWDRGRRALLLARDPLGKKPLFIATPRPGMIVFGSEIKALLAHPMVPRTLDEDALRQVLRFRASYGEATLYRGIRQVEPGTWVEFSERGISTGRHFDLAQAAQEKQAELEGIAEDDARRQFAAQFENAVRKRLVADVPVGAFLSGGLDSSCIVAQMRALRAPGEGVRTFSVGFAGDAHSELPHAAIVAAALGTRHTEVHLTELDYIKLLPEMTGCRDAPLSEPADPAIAQMSMVAKESVKVVLSGEGSDEVLCGYPKYSLVQAPDAIRDLVRLAGPDRLAKLAGLAGLNARRARVAARSLAQESELDSLVQWFSYLDRSTLSTLLPGLGWADEQWDRTTRPQQAALARFAFAASPVTRMQAVDCLSWLPGNLLERGDRMTMAAGLEMRVPFMDKDLVAFGLGLPIRHKIRGRSLKWILRRWADGRIPASILDRKKWGFRVPLAQWFRGSMREMLHDHLLSGNSLCAAYGDQPAIRRLLSAHDTGNIDANLELWTLLSAEVWYQHVFHASSGRAAAGFTHESPVGAAVAS